jgi:hypothetical protein
MLSVCQHIDEGLAICVLQMEILESAHGPRYSARAVSSCTSVLMSLHLLFELCTLAVGVLIMIKPMH